MPVRGGLARGMRIGTNTGIIIPLFIAHRKSEAPCTEN
jgi:hypothetical protein